MLTDYPASKPLLQCVRVHTSFGKTRIKKARKATCVAHSNPYQEQILHQNFIRAAAAAAVAAAFSSAAVAGGFQLTEQSALGLGRAYAGMGVDGTDVSGLYYNPATMTLHTGTQAQFGFVGVGLNLDYNAKDGGSDHDENGRKHPEAVPNLFISHQINDVTWIGFGFTVPFGLST